MPNSFANQVAALRPAMLRIAINMTRDRDRAEDLVQDAMVRALEYERGYRPDTNLGAWVHVIMRHIQYDHARKASRLVGVTDERRIAMIAGPGNPPECIEMLDMRASLEGLPLVLRQAVMLSAAGLSQDEIAVMTGVEVGTVKSRTSRGRALLREALGANTLPRRFAVSAEAAGREMLNEMSPVDAS